MWMTAELFKAVTTSSVRTKWPANTSTLGQSRQNPYDALSDVPDARVICFSAAFQKSLCQKNTALLCDRR